MAGEVSVAEGALKAGADTMRSYRALLIDELANLKDKLADLPATWTGEGAAAFTSCIDGWFTGAGKTINVLDEFESKLQASQRSYGMTDEAQKAAMDSLTSRLGAVPGGTVC